MSIDQQTELDRSTGSGTFLERLANRVGMNSKVSTVFGDPVERGGITIIPVARVGWGFGGGAGSGSNPNQNQAGEGSGGGGGTMVYPVGYIELRDGRATFYPIYDFGTILRLVIGAGIIAMLLLRSIRKLVRG
ncbi:MAG TPA: spore germination protein GerW family protein [Ktedonobacteraceae bacterium]|nr:spore germination protein GerW family protein [Ktedonobacteraceae bacterium]